MAEQRLIDANALDAALESAQKTLETNWEKQWKMNKGQVKGLAWARAILREAKSADVAVMLPKWISVEERLPEENGEYLVLYRSVSYKSKKQAVAQYEVGYGFWRMTSYYEGFDQVLFEGVTHWMPLPEPPEEVQHE